MLLQNVLKSVHGAGVGPGDDAVTALGLVQRALYHLVGHGAGEKHHEIRASYPRPHSLVEVHKYLGLAVVLPAELFVFADHAFIASDNYNTHITPALNNIKNIIFIKHI
jgi:hypothetical protein